jgi:hypothetical protein
MMIATNFSSVSRRTSIWVAALAVLCCLFGSLDVTPVVVTAFHVTLPVVPTTTTTTSRPTPTTTLSVPARVLSSSALSSSSDDNHELEIELGNNDKEGEKAKAVGNLVANDEWEGLTMELTEVIRTAVIEDMKANAREFLGKDDYKLGDISKEIDSRIKDEIANLRGKEVRDVWSKHKTSWFFYKL